MSRNPGSSRVLSIALAVSITCQSISCGTLLHPERVNQPNSGRLDAGVVILDACGLLFFLIPGIIAFAVDFSNGSIYLPPEGYGYQTYRPVPDQMERVQLPQGQLTQQQIEQVVSQRTGQPVRLDDGKVRVQKLETLDDIQQASARLAEPDPAQPPATVVFPESQLQPAPR
jgi:hypothetical protein